MLATQKVKSSVYLDLDLKQSAKDMFNSYGLSFSEGINLLLKQVTSKKTPFLDIELLDENDPDYHLVKKARDSRKDGEKTYSLESVIEEFDAS